MIVVCEFCGIEFNKPPSAIKKTKQNFCSRRCFGNSSRNKIEFDCLNCGKHDSYNPSQDKYYKGNGKYCSKKCRYAYYKKNPESVPNFKGGHIDSAGYRRIRGQREHRLVMEEHLGRKLAESEHVHHIDGNKSNNSLINLVIIPNSEHMKIHYLRRKTINGLLQKN